jgi:hypothetical protein
MDVTDSRHPLAYATVLIVSLGIADGAREVAAFAVAVFVLVGTHLVAERYGPWNPPYSL